MFFGEDNKLEQLERFSYDLEKINGFRTCSLLVLSANGWKEQNMDSSFSHQRKP